MNHNLYVSPYFRLNIDTDVDIAYQSTAADLVKNPPTIFYIPKDTKQCPGCGDW